MNEIYQITPEIECDLRHVMWLLEEFIKTQQEEYCLDSRCEEALKTLRQLPFLKARKYRVVIRDDNGKIITKSNCAMTYMEADGIARKTYLNFDIKNDNIEIVKDEDSTAK